MVILSPTAILPTTSVSKTSWVAVPAVKSPSTVSVLVTSGYISSPGKASGEPLSTVVVIKANASWDSTAFLIEYETWEGAVAVIEKDFLALLFLSKVIVSIEKAPNTVEFCESPCSDNVKEEYWYITFCSIKEFEPFDEFISTVPSANLTSVYLSWNVSYPFSAKR